MKKAIGPLERGHRGQEKRSLVYRSLLLQRIVDVQPRLAKLPQIFVVVIYNGEMPWTAPRSLDNMQERMPPGLQEYGDPSTYHLVSISDIPNEGLKPKENVFELLAALEQARGSTEALNLLHESFKDLQEAGLWRRFFVWVKQIVWPGMDDRHGELSESKPMNPEEELSMLTQTIKREFAESEARGKAQGEAKGEAKGKADSIVRILATRIGPVDGTLEQSIREISDVVRLNELLARSLKCDSLNEFAAYLKQ